MYELRELSLKFKRHFDSEIIDFQVNFMLWSSGLGCETEGVQYSLLFNITWNWLNIIEN